MSAPDFRFRIDLNTYEECVDYDKEYERGEQYWYIADNPSGLGELLLHVERYDEIYEKVDFTGTTNKEAVEKILAFYKPRLDIMKGLVVLEGVKCRKGQWYLSMGS